MWYVKNLDAEGPSILTVEEAARLLRISRAKAYGMALSGEMPTIRLGRSVQIRRDRLEVWLDERSR